MDAKVLAAIIAAGVAVLSAIISIIGQFRIAKFKASLERDREIRAKKQQAEEILSKYRDPLVYAAFELQSKLFNILKQGLLQVYYTNGTELEREYTLQNTIYVIAQYLCWREIIKREIQYLDLGEIEATRKLADLMQRIESLFLTDSLNPVFRIFRGEQRAIGEKMITREDAKPTCLGYASFVESEDASFRRWFKKLEDDIDTLADSPLSNGERLVRLQHALINLIDYLDPECVRFQKNYRQKV